MTKKALFIDKDALKLAMRAADELEVKAQEIIDGYKAQKLVPELTNEIFMQLLDGRYNELSRIVEQTWRDSMNAITPGLGDVSPVAPKPESVNPVRFDRTCEIISGGGERAAFNNPHVNHRMLTVENGKAVINQAARKAIEESLTVFETPVNKKKLDAFTKLVDAANEVHALLLSKGLTTPKPKLIGDGTMKFGERDHCVIYYSNIDKQYKLNHERLNYGK